MIQSSSVDHKNVSQMILHDLSLFGVTYCISSHFYITICITLNGRYTLESSEDPYSYAVTT